jgi:hypothetical protein
MTERDDMKREDEADMERTDETREPGIFDEDRLLAYTLGLEADPELEAAADDDAALRRRLHAMRADVDAVGAGLGRIVPTPPDDYADLSDPRWGELRGLVAAPSAPRRRPMWLRVLAPAAAIALVLVAGVVGVQRLGDTGQNEASVSADDKSGAVYDESDTQSGPTGGAEGSDGAAAPSLGRSAVDATGFATILVASASSPGGDRQRFEILRVLRGKPAEYPVGDYVRLTVIDKAVAPHRIVVLYLDPVAVPSPGGEETSGTTSPLDGRDTEGSVIEYELDGAPAFALQLPGGTDPDDVELP